MEAHGETERMEGNLLSPKAENMAGFFETRNLVDTSEYLLKVINATWDRPYLTAPTWSNPQLIEILSNFREKFAKYQFEPWLDKDPRVCLLWNAYSHILLREPCGIMVVRHPLEVADSLRKRNGFSTEKSALIWWLYHYHLITHASPANLIIIEDSSLMRGELMTIRDILSFVESQQGINISEAEFVGELDRSRIPKLRRASACMSDDGEIAEIVTGIWERWLTAGRDGNKIRNEFSIIPKPIVDNYDALLGQGVDKLSPPITKEFTMRCDIDMIEVSYTDMQTKKRTKEHELMEELLSLKSLIEELNSSINLIKEEREEYIHNGQKKKALRKYFRILKQSFGYFLDQLVSRFGGVKIRN